MSGHIQEFTIHSYRGIQNLTLNDLNNINILTGDNNSGKTSVLELLSTLDNPHMIRSWATGARLSGAPSRNGKIYGSYYNMFSADTDEKKIKYTFIDKVKNKNVVEMTADFSRVQLLEKDMYHLNGLMRTDVSKTENEIVDAMCMALEIFINNESRNQYNVYDFQNRLPLVLRKEVEFFKTVYVSPVDYAIGVLHFDDILLDSELYSEMITILKEFDEDIISVNSIKQDAAMDLTEYMILTKKHKNALPLNVYGDGMKKVLLMLSAVLKARDGILLLDEFETAIHTSAMDSVFSWLLKSAMRLNVQVFLTSHSKEAIEKVLKSDEELQPYINLYTLYNYQGENLVRRMECKEAIHAQDNLGLELR